MKPECKIISCEVLEKEINYLLDKLSLDIDVEFTKKSSHADSEKLNNEIQEIINKSKDYKYILLGYGLCGNSINNLYTKSSTLVVPRAHDCCTIFLGSRHKFNEIFDENKSIPWGSCGYCRIDNEYLRDNDRYKLNQSMQDLIEQYGKENAEYVYSVLHPEVHDKQKNVIFIKNDEVFDEKIYNDFIKKMNEEDRVVETIQGSLSILEKLLTKKWDDDFLLVEKNSKVIPCYDNQTIINCQNM